MKTATATKSAKTGIVASARNLDVEFKFEHEWRDHRRNTLSIDEDTSELFLAEMPLRDMDLTKAARLQAVTVKAALEWYVESEALCDGFQYDSHGSNARLCALAAKQL